ncbi:MAG: hypothetical protein EXR85_06310 [Xanthomonadales bacterium]|nr:hypothetical protein [Xanthomonadales bacterium]
MFHDATFADMLNPERPMIIINASDLAQGFRFSFIQGYFDLLCSDLSTYPVANAVAASSAVPVVFNPVVIENFAGCDGLAWAWSPQAEEMARKDAEFAIIYEGAKSYKEKENRKYIHYVDGGITDNMGLRAMTDAQLHLYNAATVVMVKDKLTNMTQMLSTPENPITAYFIEVGFDDVPQPQLKYFLNKVPTSFNLTNERSIP